MENKNRMVLRIASAIMAITMVICVFSSCGNKNGEEEITRGTEQIEKPSETTSVDGETTTSADGETTTNALGNIASLTTKAYVPVDSQASAEVQQAVSDSGSSGVDTLALTAFVSAMGFEYDSNEGVFYTNVDNWQRSANYVSHYDTFAQYGNMRYRTATVDFYNFDNLDWRIQMWKGQYGVFGGSEVGVYTKNPTTNEMLYNCADDNHMLYMETEMFLNKADYESGNRYFKRPMQRHWWLTGFKLGVVDPTQLVLKIRIRMETFEMANLFEAGLLATGFKKGDAKTQYDTYEKVGREFYILWYQVGTMNYISQG